MYQDIIKIQETKGSSFRLFLYRNNMDTVELTGWIVRFDFLSTLGGSDNQTDEYMSWEFDKCLMEFFKRKFKGCWV